MEAGLFNTDRLVFLVQVHDHHPAQRSRWIPQPPSVALQPDRSGVAWLSQAERPPARHRVFAGSHHDLKRGRGGDNELVGGKVFLPSNSPSSPLSPLFVILCCYPPCLAAFSAASLREPLLRLTGGVRAHSPPAFPPPPQFAVAILLDAHRVDILYREENSHHFPL